MRAAGFLAFLDVFRADLTAVNAAGGTEGKDGVMCLGR